MEGLPFGPETERKLLDAEIAAYLLNPLKDSYSVEEAGEGLPGLKIRTLPRGAIWKGQPVKGHGGKAKGVLKLWLLRSLYPVPFPAGAS